jgi:hypothetical protein
VAIEPAREARVHILEPGDNNMDVRSRAICTIIIVCSAVALIAPGAAAQEEAVHRAAPVGFSGGRMNPDISAIVNMWTVFSDNRDNPNRNSFFIKEAELAFQAYLYPGIKGDFIIALHEHHGEWEVHPEEAFVSFLDIPGGLQLLAGRKLIDFGRLNPVHPHHWKFAHTPLVMENFFGHHSFFDDGAQLDWLLPIPWDLYSSISLGTWSGSTLGEEEEHEHGEEDDHHHEPMTISWNGKIFNGRAVLDVPFGELSNVTFGYSLVWDEGGHTYLNGGDLTLTYRHPMSYKRVKWQSELYYAKTKDDHLSDPMGIYSMLAFNLNQYWEIGGRYDLSEYFSHTDHEEEEHEEEHGEHPVNEREWGATGFISYYFTHSLYLRAEYTYKVDRYDQVENRGIIQLVWGLGPHAHRLED